MEQAAGAWDFRSPEEKKICSDYENIGYVIQKGNIRNSSPTTTASTAFQLEVELMRDHFKTMRDYMSGPPCKLPRMSPAILAHEIKFCSNETKPGSTWTSANS